MRRLLRLAFCVRLIRPWRFMPGPAFTLPVAVILNRFLTEDLVFILGISGLLLVGFPGTSPGIPRPGMPYRPRRARGGGIAARRGRSKGGNEKGAPQAATRPC